ncbi:hypothetical protein FNV43_RR05219 [Rhamnella rubrinervis]|uniref:Reticulon-like protein n=1 Tax=Rhamnella rubrinervis TaxID=2594499 RepID=A0A8K0HKY4_9ROSA|nr:hypothetical protein FNV43_RR05219 [Rhamnella rubrinervis]
MLDPVDVDIADCDFLSGRGAKLSSDDDSDSDIDYYHLHFTCKNRLFGRQRPLHLVLGSGRPADIILWRNKELSACILAGATIIWLLFEKIGYHLLTFVCHSLLLLFVPLFLWSTLAHSTNMSPPELPEIVIPQNSFLTPALLIRSEYHRALGTLSDAVFGKDFKKFLMVIVALWVLSVLGNWFNFITLFYLVTVIMLIVPMLYEKYEDSVDTFAEKALIEIKNQYKELDERVRKKLPLVKSYENKKQH